MHGVRRKKCCGFNVAKNCVGGPALLLGIPVLVVVHLKVVVLTPLLVEYFSDLYFISATLLEVVSFLLAELCLLLLLVADPGFIEEPTELSCRCAHCGMEVEDFDHHCDVLGVCIGRGNMCYFILFLLFASLLCLLGGSMNAFFVAVTWASLRKGDACAPARLQLAACRSAVIDLVDSFQTLCLILLTGAAVYGGLVCIFLCLRYTYLGYQGRSSVRRRRQEGLRGSLALVFENVFQPKFSHNYRASQVYALESVSEGEALTGSSNCH